MLLSMEQTNHACESSGKRILGVRDTDRHATGHYQVHRPVLCMCARLVGREVYKDVMLAKKWICHTRHHYSD